MTKMTYVEALGMAIAAVENEEAVEKLTALKEQIAKRKSGTSKKKVEETEARVEAVYEALAEMAEGGTVTEIIANATNEVATFANQRVSALLKKLVEAGRVTKTMNGKKAIFKVA